MRLDEYVSQNIYKSLNIKRLCYLPLNKFDKKEIAPTEYDSIFRKQLLWGYVHDGNAASVSYTHLTLPTSYSV